LNDFLDQTLPPIVQEGFLLNVFPVGDKAGFVVGESEFMRDIKE
jgi:hypothetical protein